MKTAISDGRNAARGHTSIAWHALEASDAFAEFRAASEGLGEADAEERLQRFGPNRLPETAKRSALVRFGLQFHNLLIYVLLASAAAAAFMGHVVDTAVILAVVFLNAVIGYVQEGRAEKALEAIRAMLDFRASVLRDGRRRDVPAERIVPGDIVLLDPGDRVPADLRLLRARNLKIDEAILTGESLAAEKSTERTDESTALGDRRSMAFSGTFVVAGQGAGIAVATGAGTELGRISALIAGVEALKTPLLQRMDGFARQLTIAILVVAVAAFAFAILARDFAARDAFMAMVGLAVAAIPEGLPAVLTITLAIGVRRMAARNAIIRRLPAVETLGSVSVICSDKTGTLTRNEMTARAVSTAAGDCEVSGVGYAPEGAFRAMGRDIDPAGYPVLTALLRAALLCNDAELQAGTAGWRVEGDPMEGALVSLAMKAGLDPDQLRRKLPRTDAIPFDAQHRFMATLHDDHRDGAFILLKGAPERIVAMCATERSAEGERPINVAAWSARADELAAQGQRVLAFAEKRVGIGQQSLSFDDVADGATLLGFVGFIDPPREEAIAAVRDCAAAGIRVIMITGDHAVTAREIARQLGLDREPKVLTGQELDRLDDAGLHAAMEKTTVFARTTPEHKLRLVSALQARGLIVAMTGDGVNDAPALKRADVGVAMGRRGTEAAKEAAEMVLADDNFASIVAAVREGRTVYDNLAKVIAWTLPTNGGEAMTILAAIGFGLVLPVTPVQILWINMVTAVALGLTLAFEPTEPGTMARPPRASDAPILSADLAWRIVFVSALFVTGAFGIFFWAEERGFDIETARTMVVNTIVVLEIFYLFSVRYVHGSSLTLRGTLGTPAVLIGIAVTALAQIMFTYAPFMQSLFQTRPLALLDGLAIIGVGVGMLSIVEAEKWVRRRLFARRAT